jgi:hypothetical protein
MTGFTLSKQTASGLQVGWRRKPAVEALETSVVSRMIWSFEERLSRLGLFIVGYDLDAERRRER